MTAPDRSGQAGAGCPESSTEVVVIPIDSLRPADSPRRSGVDEEHIRRLAGTEAVLPPILVHRATMRVIDGMHRLRAVALKGRPAIEVRFFDGSEEAAFIRSVEANVTHGLPLSLADRRAAAARIIASTPDMSDRAVAECTGLAHRTVAAIRRSGVDCRQDPVRVGKDGRRRPVNGLDGRMRAAAAIAANPTAPLREIAKVAAVSLGTAHNVRSRLRRGEDPILRAHALPSSGVVEARRPSVTETNARAATRRARYRARLRSLRRDPSLRFSDAGRELLRWLNVQDSIEEMRAEVAQAIPPHLVPAVAAMASHSAEIWREFADGLRDRGVAMEESVGRRGHFRPDTFSG